MSLGLALKLKVHLNLGLELIILLENVPHVILSLVCPLVRILGVRCFLVMFFCTKVKARQKYFRNWHQYFLDCL